ncbi:MAG: YbbR-like domain-containing protein [candidate division WOR-3 bacterium]|jgi:YbbR domain-containing protein
MENSKFIVFLSIITSLIIFFYVKINKEVIVSFDYNIRIRAMEYFRVIPETDKITVDLSAKAKDLILLSLKKRNIDISLKVERTGNLSIPIRDYIILDPKIKIIKVYPETLKLFIERIVQKRREVKVNLKGEILSGYVIDSVIVEPKLVDITASESQMLSILYIQTEDIDISNRNESFETKSALKKPFKDIKIEPESVNVKVIISKKN